MEAWDLLCIIGLATFTPEGQRIALQFWQHIWRRELEQVTDNVDGFLQTMRVTGTCLSGGKCLSLLDRTSHWQSHDWDFYCPHEGFDNFCLYVIDQLGGSTIEHDCVETETYHDAGFCERRRMRTCAGVFDVLRSRSSSALLPIPHFHSTILVNFISADTFCIAYPWALHAREGVIQTRPLDSTTRAAVDKYIARGYRMLESTNLACDRNVEAICRPRGHCARNVRYFGDINCITVNFGLASSSSAEIHQYAMAPAFKWSVAWIWGGHQCSNRDCALKVDHCVHTILTTADSGLLAAYPVVAGHTGI